MLAFGYGTVGYWLVEGKSLLDAFYAAVLTLSTVGVEPGPPPAPGGKVFTVSLILFGVVALFTAIGVGTEVVASGDLGRWLRMNQVTPARAFPQASMRSSASTGRCRCC
jgi:voltage-gated potassium channel